MTTLDSPRRYGPRPFANADYAAAADADAVDRLTTGILDALEAEIAIAEAA